MKIKDDINLAVLENYGFIICHEKYIEEYGCEIMENEEYFFSDDDHLSIYNFNYKLELEGGRRGQVYYLIISNDRKLIIDCSEPDGCGSYTIIPDVIVRMYLDGLLELDQPK